MVGLATARRSASHDARSPPSSTMASTRYCDRDSSPAPRSSRRARRARVRTWESAMARPNIVRSPNYSGPPGRASANWLFLPVRAANAGFRARGRGTVSPPPAHSGGERGPGPDHSPASGQTAPGAQAPARRPGGAGGSGGHRSSSPGRHLGGGLRRRLELELEAGDRRNLPAGHLGERPVADGGVRSADQLLAAAPTDRRTPRVASARSGRREDGFDPRGGQGLRAAVGADAREEDANALAGCDRGHPGVGLPGRFGLDVGAGAGVRLAAMAAEQVLALAQLIDAVLGLEHHARHPPLPRCGWAAP